VDISPENIIITSPYKLISVLKAEPLPAWLPKDDWYRYELEHSGSNLVGYHIGTLNTVTTYAETVADDLNQRDTNKKFSTVPFGRYQQHTSRQKKTMPNQAPLVSPDNSSAITPCETGISPTGTITE